MSEEQSRRDSSGDTHYVLIVDDDAAIRDALTDVLEDGGYRALCAANGREALQMLRSAEQLPVMILLDLMMPVMSGWDFRREQKDDAQLADIPVVILSADRDIRVKAESVQANYYLAKPVDISVLLDTVARYYR